MLSIKRWDSRVSTGEDSDERRALGHVFGVLLKRDRPIKKRAKVVTPLTVLYGVGIRCHQL